MTLPLPLHGVRVIEFGHIAAAPFASLLLADLGADIIKVEAPDGDAMRQWPPFAGAGDERTSFNFASLNRNKRGIRADLKDLEQRSMVLDLCLAADVVIENYRPGVLDRLGLGFVSVSAGHRGVVYCSISGFGLRGAHRERGAFDLVIQAMSGLMSVTGEPNGPPVKCGVPVADFVAGLYAAYTIAALLPQVSESGVSSHIDCSMLDCLLGVSALQISEYWGTGRSPDRLGTAHPRNAPYQVFATADQPMAIAAGTPRLWEAVCAALGAPGLVTDPRFLGQVDRIRHQRELADAMEAILCRRPRAEWLAELESRGVPCGPVNTFADIIDDAHVVDGGLLDQIVLPGGARSPALRFPVRMSGRIAREATPPPTLTDEPLTDVVATWSSPREGLT